MTPAAKRRKTRPLVDIVVPVRDEEACLDGSIRFLHRYLQPETSFTWRLVIADNGSTDATPAIAGRLAHELQHVTLLRVDRPGRGRALRAAWTASEADVVAYMDVDMSTDLSALPRIVEAVSSGAADIAIGSRLLRTSRIRRSLNREVISRGYNALLRVALHVRFRDAQCGFKALNMQAVRLLLPRVQDNGWFFDTELLVQAERAGLTILEVPVRWVEYTGSTVRIAPTALDNLRGIMRLRREPRPAQHVDLVASAVRGARPRRARAAAEAPANRLSD